MKDKHIQNFGDFNETQNLSEANLPLIRDWSVIQEEAYDECEDELINDDAPITAFVEWLQKKYPNGVRIN